MAEHRREGYHYQLILEELETELALLLGRLHLLAALVELEVRIHHLRTGNIACIKRSESAERERYRTFLSAAL